MTLATIITIFGLINTLLSISKEAPAVIDEARSLIAKVEPYVHTTNGDIQAQFEALRQRVLVA